MTYLEAVNSVLRRLRENEVTSVNQSKYSKLIGELVNDSIREVSEAWNWNTLRVSYQITTASGNFRYSLTDAGSEGTVLQMFNDTDDCEIHRKGWRELNKLMNNNNAQQAKPAFWGVNGQDTNGDLLIDFYPVPDGVYNINVNMVIPQQRLSTDGTDDGTLIEVPGDVVVMGAWAKSISERGEDSGTLFGEVYQQYQQALGDKIAKDALRFPEETIWYTV